MSSSIVEAFSKVAPRAGAWIETDYEYDLIDDRIVAPRAGAWIETQIQTA